MANIIENKPTELEIDNEGLQNTMNNWMMDEGLLVSKRDDPGADFHLVATHANLGLNVDVIKPKNKSFVVIGCGNVIPIEIKKAYSNISEEERIRFTSGIQRELLKFSVEQRIDPNIKDLNLIELTDLVYVEDITRTLLMSTIKRIKHAMLFFMWSYGQKFTPGKANSQSLAGYG